MLSHLTKFSTIIIFLLTVFFLTPLIAQNYFEKQFGSSGIEQLRTVIQTESGNLYLAGYADTIQNGNVDFTFSKLDKFGNLIFTKYFGSEWVDNCLNMNICQNGEIIMCGEAYTNNINLDGKLIRVDTLGNIIWQTQIGELQKNESIKYVEETQDGNFIACGFKTDSFASNDFWFIKLDASGNLLWQKTFGTKKNNTANMCIELSNGNYTVSGDNQSPANDYNVGLVMTDNNGNLIWQKSFGDSLQNGSQGVFESTDHQIIVYGETEKTHFSTFDNLLSKIDFSGNLLWTKKFGGIKSDALFNGIEVADGFVFTGYSNSYNSGPLNLSIVKTDTLGIELWTRNFGSNGIDIGYSIIKSKLNDGYYVAGIFNDNSNTNNYLLHVTNEGYNYIEETPNDLKINIYPNPNDGNFEIVTGIGFDYLLIENIVGEKVFETKNYQNKIKLSNIEKGVYFVRLFINNIQKIQKIIIQ